MSRQNVPCLRVNGWVCYREPLEKARVPDIFKQAMSERPDEQLDEEIRGLQGQIEACKNEIDKGVYNIMKQLEELSFYEGSLQAAEACIEWAMKERQSRE